MNRTRLRTVVVVTLATTIAIAFTRESLDAQRVEAQVEVLRAAEAPANAIWLDSLDLTKMVQRRGTPRAGAYGGGNGRDAPAPLRLANVVYPHGIGISRSTSSSSN